MIKLLLVILGTPHSFHAQVSASNLSRIRENLPTDRIKVSVHAGHGGHITLFVSKYITRRLIIKAGTFE